MANVAITPGTGAASVAAETVSGISYQQIEVYGGGGSSVLSVNPDGSFKASIIGTPTVTLSGSPSISGAVTITGTPSISGAVTVVGTPSISGTVNIGTQSGSVVAFQGGTTITSVVNTVPSSVLVGASIFGQLPSGTAVIGSVATLQGTNPWIITGSVQATFSGNQSVSGTVGASIIGFPFVGVGGSVATVIIGGSVATATTNSSVMLLNGANSIGSVTALQGTNPWGVNHTGNGSVISVTQGSVAAIATISSVATANGGLPIWSPLGSRVQGTADLRVVQGTSVAVIGAQGAGVFTYVSNVQVANFGSSSVLVTIADNTTSILGYTIAPAGGGSNYSSFYKSAANSPVTASINGTASVLVSMQGFTSKT